MKFPLLLVCILLVLNKGNCTLDFSQFYLPPCCLTPSSGTFSGYASSSRIGATSKREAPSRHEKKVDSFKESIKNGSVNHKNWTNYETQQHPKIKFYSLIIPLNNLNIVQPSPTIGRVLFPEGKKFKTSIDHSFTATSNRILEKIFDTELGTTANRVKIKRIIRRKSPPSSSTSKENLDREHKSEGVGHQFLQSKKLVDKYINWESKRLTPPVLEIQEKEHDTSQLSSATEHQDQIVVKRIPSSWVKYLKRALYQSITDGKGLIDVDEGATASRNNNNNPVVKSKIRFPDTWKSIKSAKLQYVDRMAQVSTTPYGAIYLPSVAGPVVSGILVNSHDGFLHLRVASELYFPGEQPLYEQNCGCYLLSPGEILVAYWSVSRIFKENGQPALQYLVYPLPHSVPTPPELLPFSNSLMFHPSEIDPLNNFYENIQQSPNYINYPENGRRHHHHPLKYASKGHGHTMTRNPKPIQPFPNDELFLEHFNQQQQQQHHLVGISPTPYHHPLISQSPTPQQQQQQQGVPLLSQYQQFALQNEFNNNGQNNPLLLFNSIPYNDLLNIQQLQQQGPIQYEQPNQLPFLQPSVPPPLGNHQEEDQIISVNSQSPIHVDPTDLPDVAPAPEQNVQGQPPPPTPTTTFPNSIQDIISPQDPQHHQQQQPVRSSSEQMIPPSTVQQIPGGEEELNVVGQPTPGGTPYPFPPLLEHLPFVVNYPPHFPPAYMDFNLLQHGILPQGGLQNHNQQQQQQQKQQQTEGIGHDKIPNSNKDDKNNQNTEDRKVEQQQQQENHKNGVEPSSRPYMISNILDNEKKYYPVRIPKRNNVLKNYEKYRYERQRRFRKQKLVNDINNKGGYILDF